MLDHKIQYGVNKASTELTCTCRYKLVSVHEVVDRYSIYSRTVKCPSKEFEEVTAVFEAEVSRVEKSWMSSGAQIRRINAPNCDLCQSQDTISYPVQPISYPVPGVPE